MYNYVKGGNTVTFMQIIMEKRKNNDFIRFDTVLMDYLGYSVKNIKVNEEIIRRQAYHAFLKKTETDRPATLPTIRRWFGIKDYKEPSREQVLKIALSLKMGVKDAEYLLTKGIAEPSWQINAYEEIIAMYCLEKRMTCKKYKYIVEKYEKRLFECAEIKHESNTRWLFRQFEHLRNLPEDKFMCWMWENACVFKGYSITVQEYLEKYREKVVEYVRGDIKKSLDLLLAETKYKKWREKRIKNHIFINEGQLIKKYISNCMKAGKDKVSEQTCKNILELTRLVYSEAGKNKVLISELFSFFDENFSEDDNPVKSTITPKYLSDLFHIPDKKDKMFQAKKILVELKKMDAGAECPEKIVHMINDCCKCNIYFNNIGEAYDWLREYIHEAKRRTLMVRRTDLLPMILYVSQHIYDSDVGLYDKDEALEVFKNLADATLIACNMPVLDEDYFYDSVLMSCFQDNDMYIYQDVAKAMSCIKSI